MHVRPTRTLIRLMFANPASAVYLGLIGASVAIAAAEPLFVEDAEGSFIWVWPALFTLPIFTLVAAAGGTVWGVGVAPAWFFFGGLIVSALVQSLALGAFLEALRGRRRPPPTHPHGG